MNLSPQTIRQFGPIIAAALLIAVLGVVVLTLTKQPAQSPTKITQPATRSSTNTQQATPTRRSTSGLGQVTLGDGLASLNSYQATFVLTATGSVQNAQKPDVEETLKALLIITDEKSHSFDAQRIAYTYSNTQHLENYEQVRLGNSSFLVMSNPNQPPSCMAQPTQSTSRWEIIPFSYSDLGDLGDAKYVGDETISLSTGNLLARHYVVERSLLGDFSTGRADVWITTDSGYVLKMHAEASGKGDFQSKPFEGHLIASYQVNQINQSITIEPPQICTGDLPIMTNPQKMTITGNLIGYQATAPLSAVTEFYLREMDKLGWELANEPDTTPDASRLAFQKDDERISMLFTPNSAGDATYILIITAVR